MTLHSGEITVHFWHVFFKNYWTGSVIIKLYSKKSKIRQESKIRHL